MRPHPSDEKEYLEYLSKIIPIIESKLPVKIHGMTNYNFQFYFVDEDGKEFYDPNHAHISIFERLMGMKLE